MRISAYILLLICSVAGARAPDLCARIQLLAQRHARTAHRLTGKEALLKLGFRELRPDRKVIAYDAKKGTYHEMVVRRYVYLDLISEVITTEKKTGAAPDRLRRRARESGRSLDALMREEAAAGRKEFFSRMDTLVDFIVEQNYRDDHYNNNLYRAMDEVADRFWTQFKTVAVYQRADSDQKGELLGTWRLHQAPYETVKYPSHPLFGRSGPETLVIARGIAGERHRPEYLTQTEWYLSKPGQRIRFPRPAIYADSPTASGDTAQVGRGKIYESAALAMRKRSGFETNLVLMTHLVAATIDPEETLDYNLNGKFFYGAVDVPEADFIKKRGLSRQNYWKEATQGWMLTDEPIEKEGNKLHIVGGSLLDIVGTVQNIRDNYPNMTPLQQEQAQRFLFSLVTGAPSFDGKPR